MNSKNWLELQDEETIKNLKPVEKIVYPDGKEGYLKGTFFVL